MNESRLWYCDICDKTINIKSKSKHFNSKSHEHKEKHSIFVREYEFDKPLVHKIDSIFDKCIRDCHIKYFYTFEYKCVYDIKLTNTGNTEIVNLTIADKSHKFMWIR